MKNYKRCFLLSLPVGFLFAFCFVIGANVESTGYLDLSNKTIFLDFFAKLLLFTCITFFTWAFGGQWLSKITTKIKLSKAGVFLTKHSDFTLPFMGKVLILLFLWMPVFLSIFPGAFAYDAYDEWMQVKEGAITSHHPVLHVLLVGYCLEFAHTLFHSYNAGIAIYTILQMFLLAVIFSYAISFLKRYGTPSWIRALILLYWGISPTIQLFAVSVTKDTLFSGAFLIFLLSLIDIKYKTEEFLHSKRRQVIFVLSALGTMILRNNGLYVVIIILALMCIIFRKQWKQLLPLFACIVAVYFVYTGPFYSLLNVKAGGIQEMFSVPLQQMARTYNYSYDELAPDEKEMLEALIPKEDLEAYRPRVADFVKTNFNSDVFDADKVGYLKLWIKWGIEHPLTYVNSFLINTVDFWCPSTIVDGYEWGNGETHYFDYNVNIPGDRIVLLPKVHEYYSNLSSDRETAENLIFQLFMNPGVYLLVFVYLGGFFLYKKQPALGLPWVAVMLSWLTVLLGPIALVRYVLIFYFAVPIFIFLPRYTPKIDQM